MAELTGDEPDLRVGDSGEGVALLQVRLYGLGIYREIPDSTFNMLTENAVRELQSTLGQDNDGMVTRQTWEAILYLEQQAGIQYQYMSPYDALSQIRYDLEHPQQGGQDQYGQDQYAQNEYAGQLSEDGQWRWDGYTWQAAHDGTDAYAAADGGGGQAEDHIGRLSEDGQWRWDGTEWQSTDGGQHSQSNDYVGQLSEDGQWRWDGSQWQAA